MRTRIKLGALSGCLAVALGAFAAHGLKDHLAPDLLTIFEVGVRYQMYHSLAILLVAILQDRLPARRLMWSGWLFGAGIIVFSGSLYALALSGQRWFGAITPIGGVAFLAGWLMLFFAAWDRRSASPATD